MPSFYDMVQQQKGNPAGTAVDLRANQTDLDKRMQADADLLHLDKYVLKDSTGKAVKDIINVTLNRPAVFAANVFASLNNAREQAVVESDNKAIDCHYIETFLDACFKSANRRLWKRGRPQLSPFADVQFCMRGGHARRVLLRADQETGKIVCDIMPWDRRYVHYEHGEDGLKWAAYETIRAKDEVEADYGAEAVAKAVNNECSVLDAWDDKVNEIWVDGAKCKEQPHPYGFCPVVFETVSLGYGAMLLDRNWRKYDGESIFFMIRDIVPELNRLATILQTLNMNELIAAEQYQNPDGSPSDEPPERPEMGDMVSVGKGKIDVIRQGEARQAAMMLYNLMEKAFQEGSYTDIDIGNVQQPFSAVALVTIGENKDMVYMPRLAAKELLNTATAEMLIQQAMKIGGSIELGIPGHKQSFPTSKLAGEYSIDYKYFVKSPKIDVARMSLAEAAAKWYPRHFIYSDVLQTEDPDGMLRDWYHQEAEMVSPGVKQHRIIMSLLDRAEKNNDEDAAREAAIMAAELGVTLDMVKSGQIQPPVPELPEGKPMVPLLGEGGQVGGLSPNKMAANLQKMPKEATRAG